MVRVKADPKLFPKSDGGVKTLFKFFPKDAVRGKARPQMESALALAPMYLQSAPACRRFSHRFSCLKFSGEVDSPCQTVGVTTISYSELQDRRGDLSPKIEEGFGPDGLGIVSVSGVPRFPYLRQTLLYLSSRLASLPDVVKCNLEDPDSRYNIGWSHGKEKLEAGKLDLCKGSFYANPILDVPTTDVYLMKRYPSYCRRNLWPADALPELQSAFKALGKLMLDVGMMLAYHCDQYVSKEVKINEDECLQRILERSRCHKGRLLYYFPKQKSESFKDGVSSWCGWHTDHGCVTGLASGMFMENGARIACPDGAAGLYVRTRDNQIVRADFGEEDLAFQIGEITEILSQGHLCATPHCVRAPNGEKAIGVERSTFALFMQPDWDEKLKLPSRIYHQEV
ncbi:hypothetical protein AXF42_Ash010530 [Apostasia shenzhenica]|uniref:Fe2OG dioxygenase domain-containing protein n=1 Tax=Apostasia shenzhenica TaxID=1088818 RepID=A0A2I0A6B9_9ASPA|nr:hypothetical protein AXF42_Ash010530 [Apostasia shenzhenica]